MANGKTDSHVWDDERFAVTKWDENTKYKLESLRRTAEIVWGREVTIQEVADIAIQFAYEKISVQIIDNNFI